MSQLPILLDGEQERAWKTAGKISIEKGGPQLICGYCKRPIRGEPARHHILPSFAAAIYGFKCNTWWNLESRHYRCEKNRDEHLIYIEIRKILSQPIDKREFYKKQILMLAKDLLEEHITLPKSKTAWPAGVFGYDPYGLMKLISRIPDNKRVVVPRILNQAILDVSATIKYKKKTKKQKRKERRMQEYAQTLAGRSRGTIKITSGSRSRSRTR